ncbi:MAG: adenylate kinase [Spirochaetaceae bacterium]|nr:adenylate kinase [Spirochaetaceae bacterium]
MVILIGGAGCVGKTLMAQNLLERYKIPYLSIDHIKMGIYRGLFNCGFTPESEDKIITKQIWPVIKGVIMTNIENEQNIIVEGCYFPEYIEGEFDKEYLSKIVFLHILFSEAYIRKNFLKKIMKNRNIIENRIDEFKYSNEAMEEYIIENKNNKEKCTRNGIKYFEIQEDYNKEIQIAYKWINDKINVIKDGEVRPRFA